MTACPVWRARGARGDAGRARRIGEAADLLAAGRLVIVPTETVYGLAADATSGEAVARIFEAKGRPRFNPLISHVSDVDMAHACGALDETARRLAAAFWPGPLTLVVPRARLCPVAGLATAGLDTVALRMPDNAVTRAVIAALGRPLAAPSANRSGRISPTTVEAAVAGVGAAAALAIDDGPCRVGLESTIVACTGGAVRLLRPGGVTRAEIERVTGACLEDAGPAARPQAPGMLASHYAPHARVRLDADCVMPGEALLAFGPRLPERADRARAVRNLSASGDLVEAAANLFGYLRALDATGAAVIAVAPVPEYGLGEAIRDRLARAAAPRPGD